MNKREETETAKQVLQKIVYITIATSSKGGIPWNTPCFCAYDSSYSFYWISHQDCVHSENIRKNSNVAIVAYDSTVPEGLGFGIYMRAKAGAVNDKKEIAKALSLLYKRKNRPIPDVDEFVGDTPRKVYKAVPSEVWVNDIGKKSEELKYLRLKISLK